MDIFKSSLHFTQLQESQRVNNKHINANNNIIFIQIEILNIKKNTLNSVLRLLSMQALCFHSARPLGRAESWY